MAMSLSAAEPVTLPRWRDVVWPKEHGSWSLALEPLALGLLVAPSVGGAALAVAVMAGFFARRPLRIATADARAERRAVARRALVFCGGVALTGGAMAGWTGGIAWLAWLPPTLLGGAAFIYFDLQQSGREQPAELAGAIAFAWLPAVLATLAGWGAVAAASLAAVMLARAVPTVLTVRAAVRARKTRDRPGAMPWIVAVLAAAAVAALAASGECPRTAAVLVALLAARSFALLVFPRPALRASTIGMIEAGLGLGYVAAVALAWR